jgi:hypothetical protein
MTAFGVDHYERHMLEAQYFDGAFVDVTIMIII